MNLVVLSHLELIVLYVVNSDIYLLATFFCKQTIMLSNKPKTIAMT